MKQRILLLAIATCMVATRVHAQAAFPTKDSVNINKINAMVLVHGDMWWDPGTEKAHCYFPATSGKSINFVSSLWMSGYDASSQLHIAAQTYRQNGNDFWPGPLNTADTLTYATSHDWAKIWKVNRTDIQYFQSLTTHDVASTLPAILTWPGAGNTYATGNGGAALTMVPGYTYAPFVDLNSNGIYEPLLGEYPDVPGDQALWWMFSDNGPVHTETHGRPLGVEVQALAYAYNRGTLIDNVIYYKYKFVNRSANTYTNFRAGLFDDIDLGYYLDDFIGFDSSHRMGIAYNGTNDDGYTAGHPVNSYGTSMPIVGVTMIILPGDAGTTHVPAGSFSYYNNDNSAYGNPSTDTEYNNLLRATFTRGGHMVNDFAGAGVASTAHGTGPLTNYVYTGDPADSTKWSECVSGNMPYDRRFIIATNDFTLNAGASQEIVMALVTTDPDTMNGCPGNGFAGIKTVADTAWNIFYNPPPPLPDAVSAIAVNSAINIYPNPAHDKLIIEKNNGNAGDEYIAIYNALGQVMHFETEKNGTRTIADISHFPNGVYHVICRRQGMQKAMTFIKE